MRAMRARSNAAAMSLLRQYMNERSNAMRLRAATRTRLARKLPPILEAPPVARRNTPARRPMASYGPAANLGWERTWTFSRR